MKRVFLSILLAGCVATMYAQTTVTIAENTTYAGPFSVMPDVSATDPLNGKAGVQVDARLNHAGGPINLAALTDGARTTVYPDQLPADYPGINTPAVAAFWDIRVGGAAVNLTEVNAYNANGGNNDCRTYVNLDLYVTSDAVPTVGGSWTKLLSKAHMTAPPLNADYGYVFTDAGGGICGMQIKNPLLGGVIASDVTGLRVDLYCGGWGVQVRNPENTGVDEQAVSSPFLSEVDAYFAAATAVGDWAIYQ
ncbi:MAG: hypothetical protein WCK47_10345 [bacterium]